MKISQTFTKTYKQASADEVAKNAQLLTRAGYVHKELAGVYSYLPMGRIVLNKIIQIIREEMDAIGGSEVSLTALQAQDAWQKTGRWSDDVIDVWFKTSLKDGVELGLAPTHEEAITLLMKRYIQSYKDLPAYPYQFQIKFRNELRAKSGLLRGREFWMKDLYSFSRSREEHDAFYNTIAEAYKRIYARLGLGDHTYQTFASGGSFSKYSHEFQTVSEIGEDTIYIHKDKGYAVNDEVFNDEVLADLGATRDDFEATKAVEVGNIFTLGTRFSDPLELSYSDENGQSQPVFMGSYGIGPSRIMGLLAEHFSDDKGLVWPEQVAPYKVYLVLIGGAGEHADALYNQLLSQGIEVLYDDRDERPGVKFADAELLGIPYRVTVSDRGVEAGTFELTERKTGVTNLLTKDELLAKLG